MEIRDSKNGTSTAIWICVQDENFNLKRSLLTISAYHHKSMKKPCSLELFTSTVHHHDVSETLHMLHILFFISCDIFMSYFKAQTTCGFLRRSSFNLEQSWHWRGYKAYLFHASLPPIFHAPCPPQ